MARRNLLHFKPRLSRHVMEYEGRWAWEEATEGERKAYNAYLERGPSRWADGNQEIPLSFVAFIARRRERRQKKAG